MRFSVLGPLSVVDGDRELRRQLPQADFSPVRSLPRTVNDFTGRADTMNRLLKLASMGSLALVTSRRRLSGPDGAYPESLPVLAEDEAIALLGRMVGDRVAADRAAAAEVLRRLADTEVAG